MLDIVLMRLQSANKRFSPCRERLPARRGEAVLQILIEAEGLIGGGRHERSAERLNYRNTYRDRGLDTQLGTLSLRIPELLFPSLVSIGLKFFRSSILRHRSETAGCGNEYDVLRRRPRG